MAFTALIVVASPLKAPTAEILARTRPNLFDLLVALFAALAGTFAIIRGRGETIVGVAIATALMPPLATVGYGLATGNMAILSGALALFATNFLTIALAATIMARFYGFGHYLSSQQSWTQTIILLLVFIGMSVPLAISLGRIARETITTTQIRSFIGSSFGPNARVTQLDVDYDREPLSVRSVVIAPRSSAKDSKGIEAGLQTADRATRAPPARPGAAGSIRRIGRCATRRTGAGVCSRRRRRRQKVTSIVQMVALAAGVSPDDVTIDRDHRRVTATAIPLPDAGADAYRTLERRAATAARGWQVTIVPPLGRLPTIRFADNIDVLDPAAREAVLLSAWEARRWNITALGVPGLPSQEAPPPRPSLSQRRALAVAALLREQKIAAVPAPAAGQSFTLISASEPRQ